MIAENAISAEFLFDESKDGNGGNSDKSYFKGVFGAAIYIFIMAFWVYYLMSLLYLVITKSTKVKVYKFSVAILLMVIGYVMYRAGDIIDGDFIKRFQIGPFIAFLLSAAVIVATDFKLDRAE